MILDIDLSGYNNIKKIGIDNNLNKKFSKRALILKSNISSDIKSTLKIFGDVKSSSIQMNGYIEGDMFIDGLAELLSNCELVGNLQYRVLKIQDGAQFSGRCEIINDEEQ